MCISGEFNTVNMEVWLYQYICV